MIIKNANELYNFLKHNTIYCDSIPNKFHLNDLLHIKNGIDDIEMALVYAFKTRDSTVFNNLSNDDMNLAKLCYYGNAL